MSIATENITFTESAMSKIDLILAEEKNKNVLFRIKVEGGGCSGFQYKFDIDGQENDTKDDDTDDDLFEEESVNEDYIVKNNNDVAIAVIDPKSFAYLKDCTIDYVEGLTKSNFVVHNPKATAKCGCGNSFST